MKRITLLLLLLSLFYTPTSASEIEGSWKGTLKIQNISLRLIFNISYSDNQHSATLDSPDQGVKGIPLNSVSFQNSILKITHPAIAMEYNGVFMGDKIVGTYKQGDFSAALTLIPFIDDGWDRPQEPRPPFSYKEEEVLVVNKRDSIVLAGTLTLPKERDSYNAVILISGSGAQNRDQEIAGHKPFKVIAHHLSENGIAVLRIDDRGFGQSGGNFATATTTDFAEDVQWAYNFLSQRPDINKIGLIGHSEGGTVASLVASQNSNIAFIVLLASPGMEGREIINAQQELIAKATGAYNDESKVFFDLNKKLLELVTPDRDNREIEEELFSTLKAAAPSGFPDSEIRKQVKTLTTPWMKFFLNYNPLDAVKGVKCPVLAVGGTKDLQVPSKENLDLIFNALTGENRLSNNNVTTYNNKVKTIEYEGLNHLFQKCDTGIPANYSSIRETFNQEVLNDILTWIKELD